MMFVCLSAAFKFLNRVTDCYKSGVNIMMNLGARLTEVNRSCLKTETGNVGESWLHEPLCRQRLEMCVTVGYMNRCVDRDLKCV